MASVGPMFGQFGHFYRYTDQCDHPYPTERYKKETQRLLGVLEKRLSQGKFIMGDQFTIADIAIFPWVKCLDHFYKAREFLGMDDFKATMGWLDACWDRPATAKGSVVGTID